MLFAQYRRGGVKDSFASWGFSAAVGVFRRKLADRHAALVNNITHWGYGVGAAAQYGLLAGSVRRPRLGYGIPFGAAVWASSY